MARRALEDFRVLELADTKGSYCGKLLADLGAEVIKVEPPEGDPSREMGPFAGDAPHPETSLSFLYYNTNKKSVILDLQSPEGRRQLKALLRTADVLLETLAPGTLASMGFGSRALARLNPRLVVASVTGFGQTGPYKDYKAPDIVSCALGGLMAMCGDPQRPPVVPPGNQAHQAAAVHAAYAILLALYNRMITGKGGRIDISAHEVQAAQQYNVVNYSSSEHIPHRNRRRTGAAAGPVGIYPCKDGYAHFFILAPGHWRAFYDWMGRPDALSAPVWENRHFRAVNHDVLEPFVLAFAAEHAKEELFRQGQSRHLPVSPINTIEDFAKDVHNKARGFFLKLAHPQVGTFLSPGSPYRFSEPMWEIQRPAPLLGQHTTEVLVREGTEPSRSRRYAAPSRPLVPFGNIRVIDFTQAVAGPYCTKLLAAYGAEVIKLESMSHQQRGRTNARLDEQITLRQRVTFSDINGGKRDAALNLRTEKGRELAKRLIASANVVVENFSPRVMRSWGLDYPELRKVKPDIIMASLPGFGLTGPAADYLSVASTVMAVTGMMQLWTYPDEQIPFDIPTFQPDYAGGVHAAVAILAALHQWARSGKGQHIEVAQVETAACLLGPTFLEYFVNHRVPQPKGNHSSYAAPYGCYPCKGDDQWCVLAVQTEKEWESFCYVLGEPGWAKDASFSTLAARLENRSALDAHVAAWTRTQTPFQVMRALQRAGVPAGTVQNSEDLFRDPQLRERGFLQDLHDPTAPGAVFPGPLLRFDGTPGKASRGPEFAEHNAYVYGEILGLPQPEIDALIAEGVIT